MKKIVLVGLILSLMGLVVYYKWPARKIADGVVIDRILVLKSQRLLIPYAKGKEVVRYPIALGRQPVGKKAIEGDGKTPEGIYTINDKNPNSDYHLNLGVSYPNAVDLKYAQSAGKNTGGEIKIHGLKNGQGFIGRFQRWKDWTNGCMALTNEEIEELFKHTPVGTVIEIRP